MKILPNPVKFEWNKGNINKNWLNHKITNKEAEEVFINEPNVILADEKHSQIEQRFMIWGITDNDKCLSIVFTFRDSKIRIISARNINNKERKAYEKKVQDYPEI